MPRTLPADVDQLLVRAQKHQQHGDATRAEKLLRRVLASDPGEPRAAQLLAMICSDRGDHEEAVELLRAAEPRVGPPGEKTLGFYNNLANALRRAAEYNEAEEILKALIAIAPDDWQPWHNLGQVYKLRSRLNEAVAALRRATVLEPTYGPNHGVLGEVLHKLGRLRSAEASLRRCTELGWDNDYEVWTVIGNNYRYLGEMPAAVDALERAYEIAGDTPHSHGNLAIALAGCGRFDEALARLDQAIELGGEDVDVIKANRGYVRLTAGDLTGGWDDWEYANKGGPRGVERVTGAARWTPEDPGTTVMVYREQGIGDEILFASCYPDLIAATPNVIIECNTRLVPLFTRSFPRAQVRELTTNPLGQELVVDIEYDRDIPSGSLPLLVRPTVAHFPDRRSYLTADPERIEHWRSTLAAIGPPPYVGVSWRSGVQTAERRLEYTTLPEWGPLFEIPGVTWVNLQYDDCERELLTAERRFGITVHRWDDLNLKDDFDGVAALMECLDFVVAPRNAVAMLAGALGRPTAMMGNRWDWSDLGTDTSPWFPTVELVYRHLDMEWDAVIETAAARVRAVVNAAGTATT